MAEQEHSPGAPLAWYQRASSAKCSEMHDLLRAVEGAGLCEGGPASDRRPMILLVHGLDRAILNRIRLLAQSGDRHVLVVATQGSLTAQQRWLVLGAGASDVLDGDHTPLTVTRIISKIERWDEIDRILASEGLDDIVGRDAGFLAILRQIVEAASFTSAAVLITGESGTGKELVARLIHSMDRRPDKGEFVIVDCTTIVPELSGSEFFGHERGAYTGAMGQREGAFARAHHGTLFLDEVGELPPALQASLLRVVQEKTFKRLGSNEWRAADFRLICATNRDLIAEQRSGTFRRDLYYRIAACTFHLLPLRERLGDILPLARHFLRQHFPDNGEMDFDEAVKAYLLAREYPGNIRDLKQIIARMAYRHAGSGNITPGEVPPEDRPDPEWAPPEWKGEAFRRSVQRALSLGYGLKEIGRSAEDAAEEIVVNEERGNLQRAARRLKITDRTLQLRRATRRTAGGASQ